MKDARQLALNVSGGLLVAATLIMMGYLCWGLLNKEIALNNKDAMMLVLGVLLAKYSDLIGYFFGGSSQSKKQAETIDKLADTTKTAQAAALPSVEPAIPLGPGESVKVTADDASKA